MPASALYLMDLKGKILLSRNYRGDIPMSTSDRFTRHINEDEEAALTPVITDDGVTFIYIKHNNLYLMAMTKFNANAMVILNFLYRVVEVLEDYFNELVEESIRDNFVITYELLDEMMDFGYPQFTEPKILKEYIMVQEKHTLVQPPVALTTAVSWRGEGIVHKKNEIFLDVIEKLNIMCSANGNVLRSEIIGNLRMRSFLSGMPELKLGLNDKILMDAHGRANKGKAVDLEDIRFHQCVRLSRFENDRTISFIPPDGEFELMAYRLNTTVRPLIWVTCEIKPHSHSRLEYAITAKSNFKRRSTANNVEIYVPVPSDADTPSFKTAIGKVEYVPDKDSIVWRISKFTGQKEYSMRASFGLPSVHAEEERNTSAGIGGVGGHGKAPINVVFEIPYFTVSGIQVRYLKIIEKSGYQALPWVRYITQNGDYQIRMA